MTRTLLDALADDRLLGASPAFKDLLPWRSWLDFLRAMNGDPLDAEGLERFNQRTGRTEYQSRSYREAVAIVGRQSGKTRLASALVAWAAVSSRPVRDGERYAVLVAQDQRSAQRTAFSYIRSLFESSPLLRQELASETADTLRLANGVHIACYPCRPAAVRGLRCVAVVVDELAHFISTDGRPTDVAMLRAIRPTLATTGGPLIILSSPYGQPGALWELHRRHFGRDDSEVLIWQADAPGMNPTLPADYLRRMSEDDPEAYRSEVLGEFRAGLSTLLDPEQLDRCVRLEPLELSPRESVRMRASSIAQAGAPTHSPRRSVTCRARRASSIPSAPGQRRSTPRAWSRSAASFSAVTVSGRFRGIATAPSGWQRRSALTGSNTSPRRRIAVRCTSNSCRA